MLENFGVVFPEYVRNEFGKVNQLASNKATIKVLENSGFLSRYTLTVISVQDSFGVDFFIKIK